MPSKPSLNKFKRKNERLYKEIIDRGLLHLFEYFKKDVITKIKWSLKQCQDDAKNYSSLVDWRKNSPASNYAKNKNWLDKCTSHMVESRKPNGYWDVKENVINEVKKYTTISEWAVKSSSSYSKAKEHNWLTECLQYAKSSYWTKDEIFADAQKYKTKAEWRKNSSATQAARKISIEFYKECTAHMIINNRLRTNNPMAKQVYQYDTDLKLLKVWTLGKDIADYYQASSGNISASAKYNANKPFNYQIRLGYIFSHSILI